MFSVTYLFTEKKVRFQVKFQGSRNYSWTQASPFGMETCILTRTVEEVIRIFPERCHQPLFQISTLIQGKNNSKLRRPVSQESSLRTKLPSHSCLAQWILKHWRKVEQHANQRLKTHTTVPSSIRALSRELDGVGTNLFKQRETWIFSIQGKYFNHC